MRESLTELALTLPGGTIEEKQGPTQFLPGGGRIENLGDLVSVVIFLAILIASVILALYLLIGALRLIFSGGDPRNIEGARGMIVTAIVGFIIVFAAFWLLRVIETIVGGGITLLPPVYAIDIGNVFQIGGKTANQVFPNLTDFGQKFAPAVVRLLFIIGGTAAIFMILIGGLRYLFSGGDEKAAASARGQITLAIVGLAVLFSVFLILLIIQTLTKFPILG